MTNLGVRIWTDSLVHVEEEVYYFSNGEFLDVLYNKSLELQDPNLSFCTQSFYSQFSFLVNAAVAQLHTSILVKACQYPYVHDVLFQF